VKRFVETKTMRRARSDFDGSVSIAGCRGGQASRAISPRALNLREHGSTYENCSFHGVLVIPRRSHAAYAVRVVAVIKRDRIIATPKWRSVSSRIGPAGRVPIARCTKSRTTSLSGAPHLPTHVIRAPKPRQIEAARRPEPAPAKDLRQFVQIEETHVHGIRERMRDGVKRRCRTQPK